MGIIGTIRKHSWIAVAVVGIAIIAFIIGDLQKNNGNVPDLGKIDKTTITVQRFNEMTEQMEMNYKMQSGNGQISSEVENQIREQVWQDMVEETLTNREFKKLGLTVSAAEVSDMFGGEFIHPYVRQMFTDPKTGTFNIAQIKQITDNFDQLDTAMRQQWIDLEKYVKKDRANTKYANLVIKGFYTPTAIAKEVAELNSNVANVRVAALPLQMVADADANPTDADYQKYYEEHKAEFHVYEEYRNVDFIAFPVVPTQQDMANIQKEVMETWNEFQTLPTEEIAFFVNAESEKKYDSTYMKASSFPAPIDSLIKNAGKGGFIAPRINGNEWIMAKVMETAVRPDSMRASVVLILNDKAGLENVTRNDEQAKALADSIEVLIKSNKISIENAVAQYSDDPQKEENQGDMGWQIDGNYGFLNEVMLNTPENGVFTFERPDKIGYMVVKVTGKTIPNQKYRVAMVTREIVPSEATSRNIYNEANKFAGQNRTYAEFTTAAQQQNLSVRNAMVRAMDNKLGGINNVRNIVQWVYNEKTEVGTVADQIFETENMYIVATLKEVFEKGTPELSQVRPMIEQQVRLEKKKDVLMARAEEVAHNANNINAIATKLGTTVDSVSNISFNSYYFDKFGMEPRVLATIAATKDNKLIGPIKGASGVYMIQIDNIQKQPAADIVAVRTNLEQASMQKMRGMTMVLRDRSNIVDNRHLFF